MIKSLFCIALILVLPVAAYPGAEKVLLQYRQPVGVSLDYRSELDGTVSIQSLESWVEGEKGRTRTIVFRKKLDSSAEVVSRSSDGEMEMVYRFGKGFVERKEGDKVRKNDVNFRGRDIRIKMWPNGRAEVEDMAVLEDIFRKTGAPSFEEPLFPVFPKKRIRVGSTWKQKFTRRGLMIEGKLIHYVVRYKLARIEEYRGMRCAVIEGRGKLRLKNYHGRTRRGKKVEIFRTEEDVDSVIYFAIDLGIPVESEKRIKRSETREWEAKGGKEPYRDELNTEVVIRVFLVGNGG